MTVSGAAWTRHGRLMDGERETGVSRESANGARKVKFLYRFGAAA
jgi:hypothetical protein